MKKPTKILALLLALFMALTLFVACDKKDDEDKDSKSEKTEETAEPKETKEPEEPKKTEAPKKTDEDEVREVLESFFGDFASGDWDTLEDYCVDGVDLSSLKGVDFAEQFEGAEEFGLTDADIDDIIGIIFSTVEYEIDNIDVSGKTATAEVTLSIPDFDNFSMDDALTEEMMIEFMENEGYTMEELESMDAEEGEEILMELMPKMIKWAVEESVSSIETVSQSSEFTLEKDGNDWLISDTK